MNRIRHAALPLLAAMAVVACGGGGADEDDSAAGQSTALAGKAGNAGNAGNSLVGQGRHIFRYDTFGDEAKWTDALRLHEVIAAAVDPATALSVGLKVDVDALPERIKKGIASGAVDLTSPQTTLTLLSL